MGDMMSSSIIPIYGFRNSLDYDLFDEDDREKINNICMYDRCN